MLTKTKGMKMSDAKHTAGLVEAFDNAGSQMQSYSQSSGIHGTGENRLKLIAGFFNDIGGADVAAANAERAAMCWNSHDDLVAERDRLKTLNEALNASLVEAQRVNGEMLAMLERVIPHINPKAIDGKLALSGPLDDAYLNTMAARLFAKVKGAA